MTETLILEFAPVEDRDAEDLYESVNHAMGIDPVARTGSLPAGMAHHQAALTESGALVIVELWESREAQAAFMESRLGPALGQTGVATPARIEWASTLGVIRPW